MSIEWWNKERRPLISEGILTLVPLPKKAAKSLPKTKIMNDKLFTVKVKSFQVVSHTQSSRPERTFIAPVRVKKVTQAIWKWTVLSKSAICLFVWFSLGASSITNKLKWLHRAGNSNFLVRGGNWHLLLTMGHKSKYLLRLDFSFNSYSSF